MSTQQIVDPADLGKAILAMADQQRNPATKAASGTPTASYMHGFGGLFSTPGVRAPVFSALGLPNQGLLSRIPAIPSDEDNPLFAIFTGQTANTGTQPTTDCPDYPTVGNLKVCRQWVPFGRRGISSQVIDITRVGRRNDRSEFLDYQLIGNALGVTGQNANVPGLFQDPNNVLNNEIVAQIYKMGVGFVYETHKDIWTANHSTSAVDFNGLQVLVNSGYRDAIQNSLCPAADSLVRPFSSQNISVPGTGVAARLVRELVDQYRFVRNLAKHVGVKATWAFVMRETAFYEITSIWPCAYYTNRCDTTETGNTNNTNATELVRMRDEMRGDLDSNSGQFLWVDGQKVEVIIDDSIPETQSAGGMYTSDVYLLPLTVNNMPVLFIEYFNYDGVNGPVKAAQAFAQPFNPVMAVDGGRFLMIYKTPTNTCVQYQMQSEYRLILRTPFLAARTTNVSYVPLNHTREFYPAAPSNYVNGGVQNNNGFGPSYWPPN